MSCQQKAQSVIQKYKMEGMDRMEKKEKRESQKAKAWTEWGKKKHKMVKKSNPHGQA